MTDYVKLELLAEDLWPGFPTSWDDTPEDTRNLYREIAAERLTKAGAEKDTP
jgi:hypothetical protein